MTQTTPTSRPEITLWPGTSRIDWSVIAYFDEKGRLTVNRGDLDDDWYVHVTAGEIPALKRVLDRQCKPRAKSGDTQNDILEMLNTLFGGSTNAYDQVKQFLDDNGLKYTTTFWQGGD